MQKIKFMLLFSISACLLLDLYAQSKNDVYFELGKNAYGASFYGLKKNNQWIISPSFRGHGTFTSLSGGLAWVEDSNGKFGYINTDGKYVITPGFYAATDFIGPYALVSYDRDPDIDGNRSYTYINRKGEIEKNIRELPNENNNSFVRVKARGKEINGKRNGVWVFMNDIKSTTGNLKGVEFVTETYNETGILYGNYSRYFIASIESFEKQTLAESGYYRNGKKDGIFSFFHPNGKLSFTENWVNGTFLGVKDIYDANGVLTSTEGTGQVIAYRNNGMIILKGGFKLGHRDGLSEWYHDNGKLRQRVLYKYHPNELQGLVWEILAINDKMGNPLPKGSLKDGNGTRVTYDENDAPTHILTFQEGKKIKEEAVLVKDINLIYEKILEKPATSSNQLVEKKSDNSASEELAARKAYEAGNYKTAFDYALKGEQKGNLYCTSLLGSMYQNGKGTEQDLSKAFLLHQKAADLGSAQSMFLLGEMFEHGNFVNKNLTSAINWYKKAAGAGLSIANYTMSRINYYGVPGAGIAKNYKMALDYAKKAEDDYQSDPAFINHMAFCYFSSGDTKMAYFILSGLVKTNPDYANGYDSLGEICLKTGLKSEAIEHYKKAAKMGHKNAIRWCKDNNINYQ